METRWLDRILGVRAGILRRIWVILPTLGISGGVGVILWWWVIIVENIDVFNVGGTV